MVKKLYMTQTMTVDGVKRSSASLCASMCLSVRPSVRLSVCLSVRPCVCLSVCPQHNTKTNDPKVLKLGSWNDLGSTSDTVLESKGQRSRLGLGT